MMPGWLTPLPHAMGKRNEVVMINAFPGLHRRQPHGNGVSQPGIIVGIKGFCREALTLALQLRNEFVDHPVTERLETPSTRPQGQVPGAGFVSLGTGRRDRPGLEYGQVVLPAGPLQVG